MGLVKFLSDWQTLIGAVAGGIVALLAALVVAFRSERRSDLAAAMYLVGTLVAVRVAGQQLNNLATKQQVTNPDVRAVWQAEKLVWLRPKLSPMFEASMARIMPLDGTTASHLTFFHSQYLSLEDKLRRIESDIAEFQRGKEPERGKAHLMEDAKSSKRVFDDVVVYADCAVHLLSKFVLSKKAFWNRLWCRWFPDEKTKHCRELLKGS